MFSLSKAGLIACFTLTAYAADLTPENARKINQLLSTWQKPSHEEDMVVAKLLLAALTSLEATLKRQDASPSNAGKIQRSPNAEALAAYNKGVRLTALDRKQEALQSFSEAVRFDPNYFAPHFGRARIFFLLAMMSEAHDEVKKGIALIPR